ncbi:MAG: hypothetical protein SOR83_01000 [Butyricicoccus pullicaecorum]|uniref:hypothetical protein n=1 Tax=Butyricicoccus pullicaecorum TaxID=501571 RepID=UPI0013A662C3|nr:hypothetical protein [Butyricicoccus pullicaecorum]MDY2968545.1 hypothetical protein [Butyricicoccus pullicaecorum]
MDNQTKFQQMLDIVKYTHKSNPERVLAVQALIENSSLTNEQKLFLKQELLVHQLANT